MKDIIKPVVIQLENNVIAKDRLHNKKGKQEDRLYPFHARKLRVDFRVGSYVSHMWTCAKKMIHSICFTRQVPNKRNRRCTTKYDNVHLYFMIILGT